MAISGTGTNLIRATAAADYIGDVRLWAIKHYSPDSASDEAIVVDHQSNVIFNSTARASNDGDIVYFPGIQFYGVTVDTIDSGELQFFTL